MPLTDPKSTVPTAAVLNIQAAVQVTTALLYFWVAHVILRREVHGAATRANALFAIWWVGIGTVYLLAPALDIPSRIFGYQDLALATTLLNVLVLILAGAAWGLVYYLVYLYTGNTRSFWPITAFYVTLAIVLLYWIAWRDPLGFDSNGALLYAQPSTGPAATAVGLLFSIPILAAAIAYGTLFFRVHDRAPRYRIAMVSGAFLLQFGWSAFSTLAQLEARYPDAMVPLVGNLIAALAAIAILLAFQPPPPIRRKLEASARTGGM